MDELEKLLAKHREEKSEEKKSLEGFEWSLILRLMEIMIHEDGGITYNAPNNITAADMMVTALEEKAAKHPILWKLFVRV